MLNYFFTILVVTFCDTVYPTLKLISSCWPQGISVRCACMCTCMYVVSVLQWRHNGRDGVSNHQLPDNLLKRLFRRRSKKTSKLRVTGLCEGNSPVTGEFLAQRASNEEDVSIWWHHHGKVRCCGISGSISHFHINYMCFDLSMFLLTDFICGPFY